MAFKVNLDEVGSLNSHGFMGKNGFLWWVGIVVDRNDPLHLGRARVRIFGHHHHDPDILPTDKLPWANAIAPLGIQSNCPQAPVEGTFVIGFFMDGTIAQQPVMLGAINGYRQKETLHELK